MRTLAIAALCIAVAAPISFAKADPWKDESGHGRDRGYSRHYNRDDDGDRGRRYRGGERKVEYDDGNCKVERKWGKGGEYKEERKCRGGARHRDFPGYGSSYPGQWNDPRPYYGYR
jgi:hypothetical protein